MVYLIILGITSILAFFADTLYARSRNLSLFAGLLIVVALATVAGLRDYSVGYDYLYYCHADISEAMSANSWWSCLQHAENGWGYTSIIYLATLSSDSHHFAMFALSFVILLLAYLACHNLRQYAPCWVLFSFYILILYAPSLNLIRQSLAISSVFLAFSVYKKKYGGWKFWLLTILSFSFHKTSIIPIAVIVYANIVSYSSPTKQRTLTVAYIILAIVALALLKIVLDIISEQIPAFEKFTTYSNSNGKEGWREPGVSKLALLFIIVYMGGMFLSYKYKLIDNKTLVVSFHIAFTALLCVFGGLYTNTVTRLCFYFWPLCYFYINIILSNNKVVSPRTNVLFIFVATIPFLYEFAKDRLFDSNDYLRYTSEILGIS